MDQKELLEENVTIVLTPLQTLLLSESVIVVGRILSYVEEEHVMQVRNADDNDPEAISNQQRLGEVLLNSSIENLKEMAEKIWRGGVASFGKEIPPEYDNIMGLFSELMKAIFQRVVNP